MNKPKVNIPKEDLERLYLTEKQSLTYIGKIYNVCAATISNYLKRYNIKVRKSGEVLLHDFGNKQYGQWFVTNEHKKFGHHTRWKALCGSCNQYHWVLNRTLTHGKSEKCFFCARKNRRGGYEEINGTYWETIIRGAKDRNFEFNITIEYIWNLFLTQSRRCALSNMVLVFGYKQDATASLDRIDSSKGYVVGNVQWVHKDVNRMKWAFDEDYFIYLCKQIVDCKLKK